MGMERCPVCKGQARAVMTLPAGEIRARLAEAMGAAVPDNLGAEMPARIADLIQRMRVLGSTEAEEIAARFPKQLRRVGGYNIDALTPAARASGGPTMMTISPLGSGPAP